MLDLKVDFLKILFKHFPQIDLSVKNTTQNNFLHCIFEINNNPTYELIKFLIDKGVNINEENNDSSTPLHEFCHYCPNITKESIKLFFDHSINTNHISRFGYTPFHSLCIKQQETNFEIIEYFYSLTENKKKIGINNFKLLCSIQAKPKLITYCFALGTDPNLNNYERNTPFHNLCRQSPTFEMIKLSIEKGANLNSLDKSKKTPFDYICSGKPTIEILKFCISKGADLNIDKLAKSKSGKSYKKIRNNRNQRNTIIHNISRCSKPKIELFDYLSQDLKLDLKIQNFQNENCFHLLCKNQNATIEVINYCIKKNIDINTKTSHSGNALHYYLARRDSQYDFEIIKLMINSNIDHQMTNCQGENSFHLLIKYHNPSLEIIDYFFNNVFKATFDLNETFNEDDFSSFHQLCRYKNTTIELLDFFIQNGANINQQDKILNTPFHYICNINPCLEVLQFCLQNDPDLSLQNKDGDTALHLLVRMNEKFDYTDLFVKIEIKYFSITNNYIRNVFHNLCRNGDPHSRTIEYFLKAGLNPNDLDHFKCSPFGYFCNKYSNKTKNFNLNTYKLFFKNGADFNQKLSYGETPFHAICQFTPDVNLIKYCLIKGADKSIRGQFYETPKAKCLRKCRKKYPERIPLFKEIFNTNFNCLEIDFKHYFEKKEFTDFEIKGIKVHAKILEIRLKKKRNQIKEILENYSSEVINILLKWVYYDEVPSKETISLKNLKDFNQIIQTCFHDIEIENPKELTLKYSMKKLFYDENSKDLSIIIKDQEKQKKELKVHKFILQCRSQLFRKMFLSINNPNLTKIKDYSGKSYESLEIFIRYLYTEKINEKKVTNEIQEELNDVVEYFQLNPNCSFIFLL
ncbi:ankyrin repeat ph and sec7 domain containing protein secg-related [Anaeramoeba flamelloides]|uniref:Ankyrin repeat ph and sec7 domain containing protein secg-related n=1 Tax=Anaeramoeba flamelloides TaxID=1746091 RepID=A0AAV7ZJ21_9EUKA|nr:ankyrin repeat ph and sec7 domain containing protein secg-related [Anaeramoeba flamelloides]